MKTDVAKKDSTKYCEFHRDHGQRTDDCIHLRKEIEYLIRRDPTWTSSPLRSLRRSGPGAAPITLSASPNSTPATLGRNPCDLQGICGGKGVQLSPEGSSTQHQIKGDTGNTSSIQTPLARHHHNFFGL